MSRIVFEKERVVAPVDPGRADVALFVGLIRCNADAIISAAMQGWLTQQGWIGGPFARIFPTGSAAVPVSSCTDVPLPIETYATFSALFDTGGSAASFGTDYVAATVRSFFAQGGKRCYVVRVDDPVVPLGIGGGSSDTAAMKQLKLQALLPPTAFAADDQTGWRGAGHLAGLPDVSFLAIPDLPILTASGTEGAVGQISQPPSGPVQFQECSNEVVTVATNRQYGPFAPRLTPSDYVNWAKPVSAILEYLYMSVESPHEVQFVAAFPLPQDTDIAYSAENPAQTLTQDIHDVVAAQMPEPPTPQTWQDIGGISSAFLQLAYPWLKTTGSYVLLEDLEPPDGALTGILARNALTRGTFTSAAKITPAEIYDVFPILPALETKVSATPLVWGNNSVKPLIERFSLFGFTPSGLALLSDVTAFAGESYRPARIHRLVSVILRACRNLGQEIVFQQNGPALWTRVQTFIRNLMTRLWQLNALDGDTVADAFSVRCDRSTMTQNDLDNGRLIALVSFNAASTIELIRVTLAVETSGTSSQNISQLAEAS
jgi:hypothetical protein